MFVRIVKMSFKVDKIDIFLANFEANKKKIRASKGCELLELYQDKTNTNIFFTYSYWKTEKDLANYRKSELFEEVWAKTKVLFDDRPEAWSLDKHTVLA